MPGSELTADTLEASSDSILDWQIAGTASTEFASASITDTAVLASPLEIELVDGYVPGPDAAFTLIDCTGTGSITGTFTGLSQSAFFDVGSSQFQISYAANQVVLNVADLLWPMRAALTRSSREAL